MSFFERWQERGVRSVAQITAGLRKLDAATTEPDDVRSATQAKLDWLREQIEMRTRGLQWIDFKAKWSSSLDAHVGTIEELTAQVGSHCALSLIYIIPDPDPDPSLSPTPQLKEIVEEERTQRAAGELPEAAPAPVGKRKTFKELGTPSAQAEALAEQRVVLSEEEMRERAELERERLEAAGEIDRVGDAQPDLPKDWRAWDTLVGRQVEVRWRYYVNDLTKKSKRRSEYIWCQGEVVAVADGKTDKKSPQCKNALPWGAVRIKWPEDTQFEEGETFVWSVLKRADFNRDVHLGWRYAASELPKLRAAAGEKGK